MFTDRITACASPLEVPLVGLTDSQVASAASDQCRIPPRLFRTEQDVRDLLKEGNQSATGEIKL